MLIIFDLDDTLIDTSGFVTPFKLKACLERLCEEGVPCGSLERAYEELSALNAVSFRSKDAVLSFVARRGGGAQAASAALRELSSPLPEGFSIPTTPGAQGTLADLRQTHILALVTGGSSVFQREKMEKAGLDSAIFSRIVIPEDSVKKPGYEALAREFAVPSAQILVCGDRVEMDLAPARELGFRTVHMRWGRGKSATADWIDHSIDSLPELKGIIR